MLLLIPILLYVFVIFILKKLKEEGLEKFFFEDEVMPIYREVTVPMEAHGVDLDMELIEKVHGEIIIDQKKNGLITGYT